MRVELELRGFYARKRHDIVDLVNLNWVELEAHNPAVKRVLALNARTNHGRPIKRGAAHHVAGDVVVANELQLVNAGSVIERRRLQGDETADQHQRDPMRPQSQSTIGCLVRH
jgi:hypothetical protein